MSDPTALTRPVNVPKDMIYEIAMGVGTPIEIARRHGYTDAEFIVLNGYAWFAKSIESARSELEAAGFTFERKMAMLAEDLMINCYHAAKAIDVAISTKLDVAKQLAKLGRLEPALGSSTPAPGSGFAITINFRGAPPVRIESDPGSDHATIDGEHRPVEDVLPIEIEDFSATSSSPEGGAQEFDITALPPTPRHITTMAGLNGTDDI